ncbi:MAG: hypothetical protein D6685_18770 [Bacteroidetes bacterium]|nr:hypothetical protein AWN76_006015 [Rhodothermaceae bacterium RA]RMH49809.1 MAG: hypothetical protein D6685_18770 [Bacteroidota bacterium]
MEQTLLPDDVTITPARTETPDASWKRFQEASEALQPLIELDADGTIRRLSPAARRLLDYRSDEALQPSFFSHVHARNQYQVMRDLADMVCYGKKQASWLLLLRTGTKRWRWFKVSVRNQLQATPPSILLTLQEVREW